MNELRATPDTTAVSQYPALPGPADVLLTDGSLAVIRRLAPEDRAGMDQLHAEASDTSIQLRFFTANRKAGVDYVAHLFTADADSVLALVVTVSEVIVATATAERIDRQTAEVAFLVSDAGRGHGLGTLLLEHLAAAAHGVGIERFTAEVLVQNRAMLGVFTDAGFEVTRHTDAGEVTVEMSTAVSAHALSCADDRESLSESRSLAPLLHPRTVAVLGARRDGTGTGSTLLRSIKDGGFTGRVYAVHPQATEIDGGPTSPRLVDVPEHVDLAVLAVPAARVLDAMHDAVAAHVSTVVVISSGFAELGTGGANLQQQLVRLARDHSVRLVGPNCLGVMVNDPSVRLNATFTQVVPSTGGLAIASQSGGVGIALLDLARQADLGVKFFVSLGNKADVSGNDLLAAWLLDPDVTAAMLYLESFGNALKFARVAARFSESKPLLAVVGGRSAGGRRAGASHTAAAVTSSVGVDALFAQAGVVACRDAHDLTSTALLLSQQPLPGGPRVGIVSNAGGLGVLAADAAQAAGLVVPELSADLSSQIGLGVTGTVGFRNPVDLGAAVTADNFVTALTPLLNTDEVDAVVVLLVATGMTDPADMVAALAEVRAQAPEKPVLVVTYGDIKTDTLAAANVTVFDSAQASIESLAHAVTYAAWLRTPHAEPALPDQRRADASGGRVEGLIEDSAGTGGWLPPEHVGELLAPYGLRPVGQVMDTPMQAAAAAEAVGYPVAVKVADPQVVHKSDRGLVRVDLNTPREVCEAVAAFERELSTRKVPVLVQPMLSGVEIALGLLRDPTFGPLVMVAAGGVDIDVWDDRVFLLPPVTRQDAARALRSLRIWPLLKGHRGRPAADLDGIESLIVSLGQLALDVPEIAELDLNPVLVGPEHASVVDAKVRVAAGRPMDAGIPRRLRVT